MTKIDLSPIEDTIRNLREENERIRAVNAEQAKTIGSQREEITALEKLADLNGAECHRLRVHSQRVRAESEFLREQLRRAQQKIATLEAEAAGARMRQARSGE